VKIRADEVRAAFGTCHKVPRTYQISVVEEVRGAVTSQVVEHAHGLVGQQQIGPNDAL
jgi:hypothetical protein